ncbi:MAG: HIT family protein [Bdellovibrionaceae bacterium]|nr:HIT family protein [Pseudobdellovibrionaceae bacterium]
MASVFTKIISGEIPSYKIHEDDLTITILTIEPIHLGHCLVIPKQEVNHWYDVPEAAYLQVQKNAQKVAKAIKAVTGCSRVLTAAIGFEVQHYHLHLIPAWSMADLNFSKASKRSETEMKEIQEKIRAAL